MASRDSKWRLRDVVDFEVLLRSGKEGAPTGARRRESRAAVRAALENSDPRTEGLRRRIGLRAWLESSRSTESAQLGSQVAGGLRLAGGMFGLLAFLGGIGLMRGLLVETAGGGKAYHLWAFLSVTLGLQWLFLAGGLLGYLLVRRSTGALSIFEQGVAWLTRRVSAVAEPELWDHLLRGGKGYRPVASWRLARMVQGSGVLYNLGLLAGFFGCLWFLKIGFFWESSLPVFSWPKLLQLVQGLALPWSWSGVALPPVLESRGSEPATELLFAADDWWPFMMMSLAVWGALPRVLLWLACWVQEKRALGNLPFQEPRHRELWRELTTVERTLPPSGPADGVVLLDVGGIEVDTAALREFLLRDLRVNPEARYTASVLDEEREAEAWEAIGKAPLGVVFLVEGWALSPKQMDAHYQRVRAGDAERLLRFLVLGPVKEGRPTAPGREDLAQWKAYVDGLRDPAAEVIAYRERGEAA